MPLTKFPFPAMPVIEGVRLNAISAGIKNNGDDDLVLIELPSTAKVAGIFTQNAYCAAPVTLCKSHLNQSSAIRYLLINSGNANACTGKEGFAAALGSCQSLAAEVSVEPERVLPFSTGVIGECLPVKKIENIMKPLVANVSEEQWEAAAKGIMTTDTCPKGASVRIYLDGETLVVNGIAKGSGMIKPNMATMLAFVFTNAIIEEPLLNTLLQEAADQSFNRITVDGDTSTNDSAILVATASSGILVDSDRSPNYLQVKQAIDQVFQNLAKSIIRDGEGATKFVTVRVEQGKSTNECLQVAYSVAQSPLVKTALFASDPNWGRIVAAIGYAGVADLNVDAVQVYLGDVLLVEQGGRAQSYTEEDGQRVMDQDDIIIRICLGRGEASETVWTTDLSHEYIRINAEYRS